MAQRPSLHRYISALLAPIIIGALLVSPAHSERRHYSFGNPETKKKATSKQTAKFKKDMVKSSPARIVSLKKQRRG
jgi:predicted alpha/beta hydrolase family esterase